MKIWVSIVLGLLFAAGFVGYQKAVDNFSSDDLYLTSWPECGPVLCQYSPHEVQTILKQPFTYRAKGRQFYVFASQDGRYVLKFLKCQRINVSEVYKKIPLPASLDRARNERLAFKQKRARNIFASCQLAAQKLASATGVLFVHLTQQKEVDAKVTLIDRLGLKHTLEIDEVPFVLQRRAMGLFVTLEKEYPALDRRLDQLVELVLTCARHKVIDVDDGAVDRENMAFLPDCAICCDIGTFMPKEDALQRENLERMFRRFEPVVSWLDAKDPKLAQKFRQKMEGAMNQ